MCEPHLIALIRGQDPLISTFTFRRLSLRLPISPVPLIATAHTSQWLLPPSAGFSPKGTFCMKG